ncbi:MAG: Maf family protein [Lachnospiraceae bacterium]|nr:Maf family protein [Lachnospiraceae bacterium]
MEEIVKYQLVLASASPRRREILSQAGLEYIVRPSDFDERSIGAGAAPEEYVRALSRGKAAEVYRKMAGEPGASDGSAPSVLVLGADTVVAHRGRLLNKPRDRADAAEMLGRLQGDSHEVYTGVALCRRGEDGREELRSLAVKTEVYFYPMTREEIERYLDCGEYADKAGAYAIQGRFAAYIREIRGDYYNVVGLPISAVVQELKALGAWPL